MKHYTFVGYATQGYILLIGLMVLFLHNHTVPQWPWLVAAHGVGIVLIHGLIRWYARNRQNRWLDFLRHFYPVLLYTALFRETGTLNRMVFPELLDPQLIRWEQAIFGCQPSVLFMEKLPYLAVSELFYAAYFSYYLMIAGLGLFLFFRNRQQFFHFVSVVSFMFYVCYTIYNIVPVIGPRVFFREIEGYVLPPELQALATSDGYPETIKSGAFFQIMAFIYRVFESPGAALPSSHVALALGTLYFSFQYVRPIRWVHLVLAILLTGATVYCRYHYALDVVAGLLTVAVLLPLGNHLYRRYRETGIDPAAQAASEESRASPKQVALPKPE